MAIQEDLRSIAPDDPSGLSEFGEATLECGFASATAAWTPSI